ncbi:hypothetical protein [Clostridium felsineum]|uniref:Uncharacterized protein n=1 Tax=Clostridium felsineum TaxID=36839 RepID=A0A1S8MBR7_9CLOT|nr:hypothetical protein [Clostridium felsineum]URZ08957.1 hypothetical protein CLROS_043610 [Clostridium felsineum]URZ09585.1 hypothetical protein CROST_002660 [Clostridium felsineum]
MGRYDFYKDFYKLINQYPNASKLISILEHHGDILVFGGAVRDYNDNGFKSMPRDFDIVINSDNNYDLEILLKEFSYKKNRFDGYKIIVDSLEFDVWEIKNTWAFRENKVRCSPNEYINKLQYTVFLNIDSIVYNLTKQELYDKEYENAMKNKVLDVVLDENPYMELNMLRAILFKQKYDMKFSKKLTSLFKNALYKDEDYLEKLYNSQFGHYYTCKIDKYNLQKQINNIIFNNLNL